MEEQPMAYWHDLSWSVRQRQVNEDGSITAGRIERMDKLAFEYVLAKATVKTKPVQEIQRDLFGNIVTKGKKGKEKVQTIKKQYIEAELKEQNVTFQTEYQVATGTLDILNKIDEIKNMIGYSAPLVLGREYYATDPKTGQIYLACYPRIWGIFEMQLTKVQVSDTELDELGRLTKATVKFTLSQTTNKAAIKASITSPGDATLLLLQNWVKNGFIYTEVDSSTFTKKTNPKKSKWFELIDGEYVETEDKKVNPSKTYYARTVNEEVIPDGYWSAFALSPDPTVKAMIKQRKDTEKAAKKEAQKALKDEVKRLNEILKKGGSIQ